MKIKCLGCGTEKDTEVLETYPYPEDERLCDGEIEPLFVLECQAGGPGFNDEPWRVVIVCHECFRKLDPDMWISENCWKSINPVVPFDKLPFNNLSMDTDEQTYAKWKPESYVKSL
jgi:hypothetical protein